LSINIPYEEWKNSDSGYRFIPIAITDIYLTSDLKFEPMPVGSKDNVVTFAAIAALIILIASVNYVNITTARASIRAKEVGVRKTLGGSKVALVMQFLCESVIVCSLALILAIALGELFLSAFESITGLKLLENLFTGLMQFGTVALIALAIGLIAGLYPAFYLTAFEPVRVLKGQIHSRSGSKNRFRNALV
ncbi:FtsX-like permease family protein, partial [candidate division KSB1 bacterium]|nr:FtsX-like permease family protein [candidate division KSB1 bacterium]NIS26458.1 FtsX-like permease family protein [candidate division KSB1 bacterium]NIT73228.1 FtsX-like permease family protein [candidate division KSB1 bacterium]NIU27142.1 FtsX-like permease family protein [candidate division KSB1 bacterium]NIU93161.1 FtsX-like permease family protein [candidate division KSB1 bacterium]